jgi:hypothetical protein
VRFFLKQRVARERKIVRLTEAEKKGIRARQKARDTLKNQKYLLEIFFCDRFFFLCPPFYTHAHDSSQPSWSCFSLFSLCSLFLFSFFFDVQEEPAQSHTIYSCIYFLSLKVLSFRYRLELPAAAALCERQREREREDGQTQAALAERDAIEN